MSAILIIISTLTSLVEGIIIKRYNARNKKGGFIFTAFISLFSMLFFLITDTGGFTLLNKIWIYAIIAGILYASASILTFIALGCGSFALSMLVLSYSLILPTVYGIAVLNETLNFFSYIGFTLIALSIYLVRHKNADNGENKKINLKWIICIGLSFFGNGLFSVISRMQQIVFKDAVTNEFMVISLAISFICLFTVGIIKSPSDFTYVMRYGFVYTLGAGLSNGATNMLGLLLVSDLISMPLSIASPVRSGAKIIASFFLSTLLFKEKLEKRQVIGVILGGLAIVLLNIKA